ncbi:MAG: hypothetical protein H7Z38_04415, partial [Rubrivivax sp.]|nr:hypothetical protein [Pyrinomonadaceae bacterium]
RPAAVAAAASDVVAGEKKEGQRVVEAGAEGKLQGDGQPDQGLAGKVSRFFAGEAFFLRKPPPERDEYEEILGRLEGADYGQVRARGAGAQVNDDATLSAVIQGAVAALSTVSPLVAGLRGLFGLDPKIELAGLLKKEMGEASREKIDALRDFQKIFQDIIGQRVSEEPVYIFVDDLDRAQPDVALDVVESIRIALWDTRCVFIIAVDSRLISQGLRLRYKELFEGDHGSPFADKGQEYLEKIIQFGTRLPSRTSEQVQRFIAAQYPDWVAAGDFIEMVGGSNPRRLKQYCQHLTFQSMVGARALARSRRRDAAPKGDEAPKKETPDEEPTEKEMPEKGHEEKSSSLPTSDLRRKMKERLSPDVVRDIALEMGVNFDALPGNMYDDKLAEFVLRCVNNGEVEQLKKLIEQAQPGTLNDDPV